ncbi:MAG: DoxX family membrane protein [bacterium]|nr:DoxX family membrane protein [bacterium]
MTINIKFSRLELGQNLLRLGLAAVFLWFGFSQLFDSLRWVSVVPDWAVELFHLPPAIIVLANGALEVILGSLIATDVLVRIPAIILALHLIPIALDFGITATAIRDYGLVIAAFTLALIYGYHENKPEL